jgi:hypothetical protein
MYSQIINRDLPNLQHANHQITSPQDEQYNCIAWAAGDNDRWWWPSRHPLAYWPPGVPLVETVDAFVQAFQTKGFTVCEDGSLVEGYEKLALYANANNTPTHMARQLQDGTWTSKCGNWCDIMHVLPEVVSRGAYGNVHLFLSRPISP